MFGSRQRHLSALLLATTAVLGLSPGAALSALSASAANLTFGPLAYSHATQASAGIMTLTATDTGSLGLGLTNAGWNVTVLSSPFAYSGPYNGTPIPAQNLAITAARVPSRISGQAISSTGGPRTTGVTGTLDAARKTLQADGPSGIIPTHNGIGTYTQLIDVQLTIPGRASTGTYTATLTVTISTGP